MGARLRVRQQTTKIRCPDQGASHALFYPSTISFSTRTLRHLAHLIRRHRRRRRSRWRRRAPGSQALLALAHLRNGDTYARLAAGFGIATTTAWRYVQEAIALLAGTAPDLAAVMRWIRRLPYVILDGTSIPIDRSRIRNRATPQNTAGAA